MRSTLVPLLLLAASADARAFEVVHEPVTCVPTGRFARMMARGNPAAAVASAEAQFRTHAAADWYRVRLTAANGGWEGLLPQPTASLSRFEYRIVLTGTDASTSETGPFGVDVSPEGCPVRDHSVAQGSVVVQVPPGAPLVPPVPAGFSPIGALLPEADTNRAPTRTASRRAKVLFIGAAVVGGATAALVAGGGERVADGDAPPIVPIFRYTTTIPPPGSSVSIRSGQFGIVVTMDEQPSGVLEVEFSSTLSTAGGSPCADMNGIVRGVRQPLGVVLNAPLRVLGPCGDTFDAQLLHLSVLAKAGGQPGAIGRDVLFAEVRFEQPIRFVP